MFKQTTAIILAAGKSTRMNGEAKVLCEVNGRPLIHYLLDTLRAIGISRPIVVVGYQQERVRATLDDYSVQFVDQGEPRGTGHAVQVAQPAVEAGMDRVLLCYGDTPFLSGTTFEQVATVLDDPTVVCSLVTTEKTTETDKFGRITRTAAGDVASIIEYKNATPEQRELTEVNAGGFCARLPWLWQTLAAVRPNPVTNEYYLTDIVKLAIEKGERVVPVMAPATEAFGVDTPELLEYVRSLKAVDRARA